MHGYSLCGGSLGMRLGINHVYSLHVQRESGNETGA